MNGDPDLSIVVPCYNEEANIDELVRRTLAASSGIRIELLLVDDGSRDGTLSAIESTARLHPEVRALHHETNRGIVEAWRTGWRAARGGHVCITDADLQYAPEDIPRLYTLLRDEGGDVVQGRRIAHDYRDTYRYVLSLAFSFMLNRLFGTRLRDIKSGFLCAPRETFGEMLSMRYRYRHPQHFIVVNAASKGMRIRQEPIIFRPRYRGASFIQSPLRFGLRSLLDLPAAFWEFRMINRRNAAADVRASDPNAPRS
jgi:glycosyltransferase involved in cell wall biosynthesis